MIQAVREIEKDKLTEEEEAKIIALLKKEDQMNLLHDIDLAPVWIQKIMEKSLSNGENDILRHPKRR